MRRSKKKKKKKKTGSLNKTMAIDVLGSTPDTTPNTTPTGIQQESPSLSSLQIHNTDADTEGTEPSLAPSAERTPPEKTTFVDILGNTGSESLVKSVDDKTEKREVLELMNSLPDNLTSIHSEVTSPIGESARVFETSFLNVGGREEWRGEGTPPGTSVGAPVYTYDQNNSFAPNHSLHESTPLLFNQHSNKQNDYAALSPLPEALQVKLPQQKKRFCSTSVKIWSLIYVSLLCNLVLFSLKVFVWWESRSLAVLASAVDSFLDLVSQGIVYLALRGSQDADEETWPVGRSRLEPIGIIVCASLMGMASLQVVYQSVWSLVSGWLDAKLQHSPELTDSALFLLSSAIVVKAVLFTACLTLRDRSHSVMVLAEDHRNDILSNGVALGTAYLSMRFTQYWWLDATGAVLISVYICVIWVIVAKEQAEFLVGRAATPEFLERVRRMSSKHHSRMSVDVVRAYHFGKRFLVEIEVVLPKEMCVHEAHDIALDLQKKVERLHKVERAFVHVDYMARDHNEHKRSDHTLNTPPQTPPSEPHLENTHDGYNVPHDVVVTGALYDKTTPMNSC